MKTPKTFRLEKNLNEKTKELIQGPKITKGPDEKDYVKDLMSKLEKIALKKGKLEKDKITPGLSRYIFKDEDYGLLIGSYYLETNKENPDFFWHNLTVGYKGHQVFYSIKYNDDEPKMETYIIGPWESRVDEIYDSLD